MTDLIKLDPEQVTAWHKLSLAIEDCQKASICFYLVDGSLYALNGRYVERVAGEMPCYDPAGTTIPLNQYIVYGGSINLAEPLNGANIPHTAHLTPLGREELRKEYER